jgi:hypothetical protein
MKKRGFVIAFILSNVQTVPGFAITATDSLTGAIKATVSVDRNEVPLNGMVVFNTTVEWDGKLDRYEVEPLDAPVTTNLAPVSNASKNWVGEQDDVKRSVKVYEFTYVPVEQGMAYIDGPIVEYRDKDEGGSYRLTTGRVSVKVVEAVDESAMKVRVMLGAGILGFLVLGSIGFILIRQKRLREKSKVDVQFTPIEDTYLTQIRNDIDVKSDKLVDAFSQLSKLMRKYIAERYHMPLELATNEVKKELQKDEQASQTTSLIIEILETADLAKFSGGQIERHTFDRAYTLAEEVLEKNKIDFIEYSNTIDGG